MSLVTPARGLIRASADENDAPVDITITQMPKPDSFDLTTFAASYQNGWFAHYPNITDSVINGHQARIFTDLGDVANYAPVAAAFVVGDSAVVIMTLNDPEDAYVLDNLTVFNGILSTLRL